MGKKIICSSCGAEISEDAAKCPYCGSAYYKGSEREYMGKLENVREELENLGDAASEELIATAKRQSKKWIKLLVILVVIIGGMVILITLLDKAVFGSSTDYRAQYAWQTENFPKLDALYDAGQYEEMVQLYNTLSRQKNANLFEWQHHNFYTDYTGMQELLDILEEAQTKELDKYALYELFYLEWDVKFIEYKKPYNETELAALKKGMEAGAADFETRWHMNEHDYEIFEAKLKKADSSISMYSACRDYVDKWMKENR